MRVFDPQATAENHKNAELRASLGQTDVFGGAVVFMTEGKRRSGPNYRSGCVDRSI